MYDFRTENTEETERKGIISGEAWRAAECLGVCSVESYERHGSKAHEIDVTDMSVDEILDIIVRIINGERIYPVGVVDYLGWFVKDEEGSD